jgi:hypothetical protein
MATAYNVNLSVVQAVLKEYYKQSNYMDATFKERPLFGMLPKANDIGGLDLAYPTKYANAQGRSIDLSTAQANANTFQAAKWQITPVVNYAAVYIDGPSMLLTKMDDHTFVKLAKEKIADMMNTFSNDLETKLFRTKAGSIGTLSAVATTALTYTIGHTAAGTEVDDLIAGPGDIMNIEVGMKLVSAAATTGALRVGVATVTGVNRRARTFTVDADFAAEAIDDLIFIEGDHTQALPAKSIAGLSEWLISTADLFGVTRTTDSRLQGVLVDGSGDSIEAGLIDAQAECAMVSQSVDKVLVHHLQYRNLIKSLENRAEYTKVTANGDKGPRANVGYAGVKIHGANGEMSVIASSKCPSKYAFGLSLDNWTLNTAGSAPIHVVDEDSLSMLRSSSADSFETRLRFVGQLYTKAPNSNFALKLPSVA